MHSPPEDSEVHTFANGKIKSTAAHLDGSSETRLSKESWREAHGRFERMIRTYCSLPNRDELAAAWSSHFKLIEDHPCFSLDFSTLLVYDIRCRQAHHLQAFDPSKWQDELWRDVIDERLLSQRSLPPPAPPISRTVSDRSYRPLPPLDRSYRPAHPRARSTSPRRYSVTPCVVCSRLGHRTLDCSSSKSFLVRQGRLWVLPNGKQVCFAWNSTKTGCSGCERQHVCTLCGEGHSMLRCPRYSN